MPSVDPPAPNLRSSPVAAKRNQWAVFVSLALALALIVGFYDDIARVIRAPFTWIQQEKTRRLENDRFARFEDHIAFGRLLEARSAAGQITASSQKGRFSALLLDAFDGPRKWDSKDPTDQRELLAELKTMPPSVLNREAQILLEYRLDRPDSTSSQYFRRLEPELRSPYVRFLAAREAEADTQWAARIWRSVISESSARSACALAIETRVWLARLYRRLGKSEDAESELSELNKQLPVCRDLEGSTVEVRYRGELLLLARSKGDDGIAEEQLSKLADLAGRPASRSSDEAPAVSLHAYYWIADDRLTRGAIASAERASGLGLAIADSLAQIRDDYPYVSARLGVLWAQSRLLQGEHGDDVQRRLVSSAVALRTLTLEHPDSFHASTALCHYLLAELYLRRGKSVVAFSEFNQAEQLRSTALELGSSPFEYEATRARLTELLRINGRRH